MTDLAMPELRDALVEAARTRREAAVHARREVAVHPRREVTVHARREATVRRLPETAAARARAGRSRRVLSQGRLAVALVALLLGSAAAAYAGGLISFGSPAPSAPVFANPRVGLGGLAKGSGGLLPISAPDPDGGPAWGMRILSSTRGAGCLQVGRLVDGKLVALGRDGAFDDDGLAHQLPASADVERLDCALLDAHGRLFESVTIKGEPASAAPGVHCRPPGVYAPSRKPAPPTCPLADERDLYFGTLGPDARGITYTIAGHTRTAPTVGSDGAYLIVTTGTPHRYTGAAGSRERAGLYASDEVPVYSPITEIHYSGGVTCHLQTAQRWIYGSGACSPAVPQPYGYAPTPAPTPTQVATPIHTALLRGPRDGWEIRLHFTSKLAISSLRGQYELQWRDSGMPGQGEAFQEIGEGPSRSGGMIPSGEDIAAGQAVSAAINPLGLRPPGAGAPALAPGVVTGQIVLGYHDGTLIGAEEDKTLVPVGSFTVRVP